jgi:hypothetical protein
MQHKTHFSAAGAGLRRRHLLRFVPAIAVLGLAAACTHGAPANLDLASERLSEQGAFRVSYKSDAAPVPIHRLHTWTLHVASADGRPVTDANVKVDGDMPGHGHGMPTRPRVTRNLGGGNYLVEGMKFQMGGWWVMEVTVDAGGRHDVAKFNLRLDS